MSVPSFVSLALGSAFFRLGRLADAEREYKATIAADPKTGEAHSNLAVVYLQTGRFDDAEKVGQGGGKDRIQGESDAEGRYRFQEEGGS